MLSCDHFSGTLEVGIYDAGDAALDYLGSRVYDRLTPTEVPAAAIRLRGDVQT